ncbi:HIT family protein [Portibacter lacus]|uniref:HIT family protein n=1 Tax=Portibacter lacus TaxID=1099794 RepID=A0AA37SR23_9BACT|nr:HIT family protein [Portibacter lacus]GLR18139.1 HIT family protein [Portibacter lacus]
MASIFSKIIKGDIPCYKIAETEDYFAFLDINPLAKGHTLVIPKREEDYIFDLGDEELAGLMSFSKKIAKAIEQVVPCERIGVTVIGLEVPHAHVHLIPINTVRDMDFGKERVKLTEAAYSELATSIRSALKVV